MNKPAPITPGDHDDDIGPIDANGQQILSPEEEAMFARLERDPAYLAMLAEAEKDCDTDDWVSHDEMLTIRSEQRRRWFADRDMADPKA